MYIYVEFFYTYILRFVWMKWYKFWDLLQINSAESGVQGWSIDEARWWEQGVHYTVSLLLHICNKVQNKKFKRSAASSLELVNTCHARVESRGQQSSCNGSERKHFRLNGPHFLCATLACAVVGDQGGRKVWPQQGTSAGRGCIPIRVHLWTLTFTFHGMLTCRKYCCSVDFLKGIYLLGWARS